MLKIIKIGECLTEVFRK